MPHPFDSIPEIARLDGGHGLIRLPFGQDVPFTPRVRALVDTAAFQRLRHISQLGLTTHVYPGATHTRFEHALGVFHNAILYLVQLGRDPRCAAMLDTHSANVLLCAALLHDIGHWPFCHPIEDLALPELRTHEEFAAEILQGDAQLRTALEGQWNVTPEEILDVLNGSGGTPALRLIRSILSGPIDIDKLDYLERDSLHAGVPYGRNLDKNRLISSLVLNESGDGLAISTKGKTAAELMVFARYVMFSEVYWHHAVRGATAMFTRAFYESLPRLDRERFLRGTEAESIQELIAATGDSPWAILTDGLFGPLRRLHKQIAEWGPLNEPMLYSAIARRPFPELVRLSRQIGQSVAEATGQPVGPADLLIDSPPPGREIEFKVDIFDAKSRTYRPLNAVSPVTEALAKHQFDDVVKRVRLFVHPRLRSLFADLPDLREHVAGALERL